MKKIILTLLCLTLLPVGIAKADGETNVPDCKPDEVLVCRPKVVKRKKRRPPKPPAPPTVTVVTVPGDPPPPVVVEKVVDRIVIRELRLPCPETGCPPEEGTEVGFRLALGLSARDQHTRGLVSLRLEWPKTPFGLDVFSEFQYGVGAQVLLYPYRSQRIAIHVVDPGVLVTGDPWSYSHDADVERRVELLFGAGLQLRVACHVWLTADVRTGVPLSDDYGCCVEGKKLDASRVVGNAFGSTTLFLGVMVRP